METSAPAQTCWRVPAALFVCQVIRIATLLRLPTEKLIAFVPDDAFYYLVLARNFALDGRWTFDGQAPASGFHLLWGYLLAVLAALAPQLSFKVVFALGSLLQCAVLSLAAWLVCTSARRLFGDGIEPGIAIVFFSTISLTLGTSLMEAPFVLLCSAAAIGLLCRERSDSGSLALLPAVLLGMAGMLARSDFGLLPICLLVLQAVLWRLGRSSLTRISQAVALLAGSLAGLLVLLLHTHWISGEWTQSSAQEKLYWSRLAGYSFAPVLHLLFHFFDVSTNAFAPFVRPFTDKGRFHQAATVLGGVLVLALVAGLLTKVRRGGQITAVYVVAFVGILGAYVCFYRLDAVAVQPWYLANLEVPLAMLAAAASSAIARRHRSVMWMMAVALVLPSMIFSLRPLNTWQPVLYRGAIYLREHPELKPAAAWNAGILSYFGGDGVINLDGLVNDEIMDYAKSGHLKEYAARRGLRSIFDSSAMFGSSYAERGGYASGALLGCMEPQILFPDDPNDGWLFEHFTLFRVRPGCLTK